MKRIAAHLALTGLVLAAAALPAMGWHGEGHARISRIAVRAASDALPEFFGKGIGTIAHSSVDPDMFTRPIAPAQLHAAEAPEHYLDYELVSDQSLPATRPEFLARIYAKDLTPKKVGLLPYAITEWTQKLTVAFAEHRRYPDNPHIRTKCLIYAGILGHYAADLAMPLHTTIHFNGRVGEDGSKTHKGIHLKTDRIVQKLTVDEARAAGQVQAEVYPKVFPAVMKAFLASHARVDRVYELADEIPAYAEPLKADSPVADLARERMLAGAGLQAGLYRTAWTQSADIELPDWYNRDEDRLAQAPPGRPGPVDYRLTGDAPAGGTIRVATYNVEHFMRMFDQALMPQRSRNRTELFRDDEDLYEVARTMSLPEMDADIVGLQESCSQEMLERFNRERLGGRYQTVIVFPSNSDGQYVALLAKPGFTVLDRRTDLSGENDPVRDPGIESYRRRGGFEGRLFSRGPGFVKFRTPSGHRIWVGVTHVKSKAGNSEAVTRWRIREIKRTREICGQLLAQGDADGVIMLGDFNDDFGRDELEQAVGADAVAQMLAGTGAQKMVSPTRELARRRPNLATYHCEIKPRRYRSFIDHIFLTPALAGHVQRTYVVDDPIAAVASDHFPVVIDLALPPKADE
jgi:endonuclease/exonuclease/phosphatase family metal-dependent hydrolase